MTKEESKRRRKQSAYFTSFWIVMGNKKGRRWSLCVFGCWEGSWSIWRGWRSH